MMFENLSENSRVWVYASDKVIAEKDVASINKKINTFLGDWVAHGSQLIAGGEVIRNRFLVLAVDESKTTASGCSIDTSVNFIKNIENQYNINLFDRLNSWIEKDGTYQRIHFSELSNYPDWHTFNPVINTLKEFRESWIIKVKDANFIVA